MYAYYTLVHQFLPACGRLPQGPGLFWAARPGPSQNSLGDLLRAARTGAGPSGRGAGLSQRKKADSPHLGRVSARAGEEAPKPPPNSTEAVAVRLAAS